MSVSYFNALFRKAFSGVKQVKSSKNTLLLCTSLLGLAFVGCGKEEGIKVYSTPKEINTQPAATGEPHGQRAGNMDPGSLPPSNTPTPKVTWTTPASWEEVPATSMRVGNFTVSKGDQKAEIAILPFPGSVGSELENVNRWRGEIGLAPVKEGEFTSEKVQIGEEPGKLYDLQGATNSTVAAMVSRDGVSWFFKMRGSKELVAENKGTFVDFLKTIIFFEEEKKATQTASAPTEPSEGDHSAEDHGPKWDIPKHWKLGAQKPMVLKNWNISGEGDAQANMAVSSFPGDVGGVVANVNRWRGQLGLKPMTETEVRGAIQVHETSDGHSQAAVVDFKGTDRTTGKPSRLVAAILPHGGDTWFYKLTGEDSLVEREKEAFLKLVKTASYH